MTTKQAVPEGMKVGIWSEGVFTPIYEVNNGRMELPNLAGQPAMPLYNGRLTITDDTALDINFGGPVYNGWAVIHGSTFGTPGGLIVFRAGGTSPVPYVEKVAETNPFTILNNTALTGTSGVDGELTISTTDGHLYVESRLGNNRQFHVSVFGVTY